MRPACEIMAKHVLPAVRVVIVKKLVEEHGMKQTEVAKRLGITQPAVSQYLNKLRGSKYQAMLKKYNIMPVVNELADKIASGKLKDKDFSKVYCYICAVLSKKGVLK
jgi:hypothetical protein